MQSGITPHNLEANIQEMTDRLLQMARTMAYNFLSPNCRYILSEITANQAILTEKDRFLLLQKQRPVPQPLDAIMPEVLRHYPNFYDLGLYIHQGSRQLTIIDIRYHAKSSLAVDYQQSVAPQAPMLHCKVSIPYWVAGSEGPFDINWKTYAPVSHHKRWWLLQQWRFMARLHKWTALDN